MLWMYDTIRCDTVYLTCSSLWLSSYGYAIRCCDFLWIF